MKKETEIIVAQYQAWVYPQPISDMAEAVIEHKHLDPSDPALFRRKLWPKKVEPDNLDILIAGCGTNQAAYFAFMNPQSRVVGIDLSETALGHGKRLKQKHNLQNLDLHRLDLEQVASLGQAFDLIVCTGVLHHLTDPDAGLRRLRDVLKPHGVMSLMVYGYYPRVGVYMMQDAFRVLGLQQDSAGIEMVKHTLDFTGQAWLDYIPSLRPPITVTSTRPLQSSGASPIMPMTVKRDWPQWHYLKLFSAHREGVVWRDVEGR